MIFINTCRASMKSFMNTAVLLRPLYSYCYYWSTAVRMQIPSKLQYLASPRLEHLSHIRTYTSRTYQPHAPVLLWPLYSYCYYWSTAVRMQIQSKLQYLASARLQHLSHIRTYTSRTCIITAAVQLLLLLEHSGKDANTVKAAISGVSQTRAFVTY